MDKQEVELTLDNLDILTNDYHRDVIRCALHNKKFDRIFYTHKPKQMSVFRFVEFHGAYQGQTEFKVSHKALTFHSLANIIFDNAKGSFFDDFVKVLLQKRAEQ